MDIKPFHINIDNIAKCNSKPTPRRVRREKEETVEKTREKGLKN